MSEEITSQADGIMSDGLDEGTDTTTLEHQEATDTDGEGTENKAKKSNVAKLLSKKNAEEKRVKELEDMIANQEFNEEKVQAMIEQAQLKAKQEAYLEADRDVFVQTFWEEKLEDINAIRNQHPTMSFTDAAKFLGLWEVAAKPNPNRLSFSWNTPSSLKQNKQTKDLDDAELRDRANSELKSMLWIN